MWPITFDVDVEERIKQRGVLVGRVARHMHQSLTWIERLPMPLFQEYADMLHEMLGSEGLLKDSLGD